MKWNFKSNFGRSNWRFHKPPNFIPCLFYRKKWFPPPRNLFGNTLYIYIYPKKLCGAGFLLSDWWFKKGRISRLFTTNSGNEIQIVARADPYPLFQQFSSRDPRVISGALKKKGGEVIIFAVRKVALFWRGYVNRFRQIGGGG